MTNKICCGPDENEELKEFVCVLPSKSSRTLDRKDALRSIYEPTVPPKIPFSEAIPQATTHCECLPSGRKKMSFMSVACWLCYKSRNICTTFSEGRYLSVAMVSNLQIFVVAVPVVIILGSESQASFFIRVSVVWLNDLAVLALLFGNLIHSVHASSSQSKNSFLGPIRGP